MPKLDYLEKGSVPKTLTKLALPSVVAMTLTGLTNMASTLFAIPLGETALAAMGVVFSAMSFIQSVGYTLALGGSTLLSPLLSEERDKEIARCSATTVFLTLLLGTVMAVLGLLFPAPFVKLLGATPALLTSAVDYARPVFLASPFVCANYAFTCLLRCVNRSAKAMIGMVAGGIVTLILTPVFFHLLQTGVMGGGLAFLLGQGVSFGILLFYYVKTKEFSLLRLSLSPALYVKIPYYGMSSLVRQGLASVSLTLLNRRARAYGVPVMAAISLSSRITGLLYSALLGWGQGFTPLAGYAYGKGQGKRITAALSFALKIALGFMTLSALALWFFGRNTGPNVKLCLYSSALALPLIPLGVLTTMAYQAIKKPLPAALISSLRQGLCFLPLLFLLPLFLGAKGLLITQGVADLITFLFCLPLYRRLKTVLSCFSKEEVL